MNNTIPSVDKAASLIGLLASSPTPLTQAALARKLDITPSTTYRILQTLVAHRWIRKTKKNGFELWNGMLPIVYHFHENIHSLDHARELLNHIAEEHQFACKLSIRRGNEQLTIIRAEPYGPFSLAGHTGASFPLIEGSVGAALLCDESDDALVRIAETCKSDIAEARNPQMLVNAVHKVRETGYYVNATNNRWRICAVSAPVRTPEGDIIAALTFIGAESDFTQPKLRNLIKLIRETAEDCGKSQSQGNTNPPGDRTK